MAEAGTRAVLLGRRVVGALSLLLMLVALVAYVTDHMGQSLEDLGELAAALLAAAGCGLTAALTRGRLRIAWAALATASLSWAVGEAIWSFYELARDVETPFPSLADLGFLGFPVGAMAAVLLYPAGASRSDRRRMVLDGLMVASAIGLVSWATALGAVVDAGGDTRFATVVSVAYPLTDLALLVVCVLVLSRSTSHRAPLACIAGGLALMAFSDSAFAYLTAKDTYGSGSPVDLGWFFAFGLLALAPLTPGSTSAEIQADGVVVAGGLLPYVPLAAALGFVGWREVDGYELGTVEVTLSVFLVVVVLVRQFLTVRDNQLLVLALAGREAELRHQAFHDRLTGLANRALYVDRVGHALELHRRNRRTLAICFVDLDGFKAVNDSRGHAAGDELLRQVAQRFHGALTEADTLARLGGDEFAVLLEDGPPAVAVARTMLNSLQRPFVLAGKEVSVQASIGVASVDSADETPTVDELLRRADVAMYVVKRRGKADVLAFTPELHLDEIDDSALGTSLSAALRDHEVTVVYQPIVDLRTRQVHTLEALARWSPEGQPVSPEVFIPVAERLGLLPDLFQEVLRLTCRELGRWTAVPGGADVRASVNLSPRQLSSPVLVPVVVATLAEHGLSGDRLVLEITETDGLTDSAAVREACAELRALGVRLSVDDFGIGLSSLARLRDLPVDEVKIDRSFITGVDTGEGARRFVRGVLAFAAEFGLDVVAEGVEREAERDVLAELGCHRGQGYLFSRPVPAEDIDGLLAASVIPAQAPPS
jgi:diguanylate cyclase (GGDEF)-like protein